MVRSGYSPAVLKDFRYTLKRLAILGSTGSIGQSTLSIVEQFPERYSVAALAAGRNLDEAFAQAVRWRPRVVSLATEELAGELAARLRQAGVTGIEAVYGTEGTVACSTLPEADFVVSAIVGVAGLDRKSTRLNSSHLGI